MPEKARSRGCAGSAVREPVFAPFPMLALLPLDWMTDPSRNAVELPLMVQLEMVVKAAMEVVLLVDTTP
jgi:hypothetical protein